MRKWVIVAVLAIALFATPSADAAVDNFDLSVSGRFEIKGTHDLDGFTGDPGVPDTEGPHGRFWLDLNPRFQASNESVVVGRVRLGGTGFEPLTSGSGGSFFHGGVFEQFDLDRLYVQNDSSWWNNGPQIRTRVGRQGVTLLPDLFDPTADGVSLMTRVRDWSFNLAYLHFNTDENALGLRAAGALNAANLGLTLVRSDGDDDVLQWGVDIDSEVADGVNLGALYVSGHAWDDVADQFVTDESRTAWQVHGRLGGERVGLDRWSFNARYRDVEDGFATRFGGGDSRMLPVRTGNNQARRRVDDGTHWQVGADAVLPAGPLNELLLALAVRGYNDTVADEDKVGYAVDLGWVPGNGLEVGVHYTSEWQEGARTYYGPSSGMYYYLPQDDVSVTAGWRYNF